MSALASFPLGPEAVRTSLETTFIYGRRVNENIPLLIIDMKKVTQACPSDTREQVSPAAFTPARKEERNSHSFSRALGL